MFVDSCCLFLVTLIYTPYINFLFATPSKLLVFRSLSYVLRLISYVLALMTLIKEMQKQGNFLFRYRGILPIVILVAGLIFHYYSYGLSAFDVSPVVVVLLSNLLCLVCCFFGLAIRVATIGYASPNTSGRNTKQQKADSLNTTGIYATVRHPLYVGNFFMWLGIGLLTQSISFVLIFILSYWLYYERIMLAEEQFLTKKFGEQYTDWAAQTPAFIPKIGQWTQPPTAFNWKKVIKRERSGLLAIFSVFLTFKMVEMLALGKSILAVHPVWLILFGLALLVNLGIKFLEKRSLFLEEMVTSESEPTD